MKFLYIFGLFLGIGVSVAIAQPMSTDGIIITLNGHSCRILSGNKSLFTGTCSPAASRLRIKNNTYSNVAGGNVMKFAANDIAQGGPCSAAGHNESLCLDSSGCKWFSPQGTRNGREISQNEKDLESFCYDNCARQPLQRCSETTGCVIGQKPKIKIINSYSPMSNDSNSLMEKKCVRASTVRG